MSIFRVIPWLIPFFIQALVELRLPFLGKILSIFQNPISDADALRQLDRAQNWRPKRQSGFNDASRVIKVSDAIACVQTQVNTRIHWIAVAKELIRSLVGTPGNAMTGLGDSVVECLRKKSLGQNSPRIRKDTKTKLHRPALGHGKGRTHF